MNYSGRCRVGPLPITALPPLQDEVLAHRLGLIPILANPEDFDYRTDEDVANEGNTIVFKLKVKCIRKDGQMVNSAVTSNMLEWLPNGSSLPEDSDTKLTAFMHEQVRLIETDD